MKSESEIYSRYFTYVKTFTKIPIIRTYGHTIFTLIMLAVFIIFAIKPTVGTILILQKKLADSNKILEKLTQKANNLTLAKENYNNLDQSILYKISLAVPDKPDLKSFTQALESVSQKYDASISALQIQPQIFEAGKKDFLGTVSEIEFTFNITGAYKNLISILQDLKQSSRLISVDKLSLSQLTEGSGLTMSIVGKAYYLK